MSESSGVVAVIQARMGSKRLPGKMLKDLGGVPLLMRVVERVRAVPQLELVAVATSTNVFDDPLVALCETEGVAFVRGSEADVLGRFCVAAARFDARHVLRVTGDAAFFDPVIAEATIALHLRTKADYTHSITAFGSGYPAGVGSEVFSRAALDDSCREASSPAHREHVDEFVFAHKRRFRIEALTAPPSLCRPELDLSVDDDDDLALVRRLYGALGPLALTDEVVAFLEQDD